MIIELGGNRTYAELMAAKPVEVQAVRKDIDRLPSVLDLMRPNQFILSKQEFRNYALTLQLAYYLEQNTSIFADIVLTLQQEIFRRGFSWKPKFVCKCMECGTTFQEKVDRCDCGCTVLAEPDRTQLKWFKREDGKTFLEKANLNDQPLKTVLWTYDRHAEVSDNPYLLCVKNYIFDSADINQLLSAAPIEFLPLDPREVRLRLQSNGLPKDDTWICVLHRDKAQPTNKPCQACGRQTYPAYAETYGVAGGATKYYLKSEIYTQPFYYPGIAGGFPPILKILYNTWAYHHLERWTYDYYKEGHGRGILAFPTNNQESLRVFWEELVLKWQEEPSYTPAVAISTESGKSGAQFIKLLEDPNPQMLEVKKDLRERIGSFFGVTIIFQNDTSGSGGLKNDQTLIRVTDKAVEFRQSKYNGDPETNYTDGVLAWICGQFGITDFVLQLNPNAEQDEMIIKDLFAKEVAIAKDMTWVGYVPQLSEDGKSFKYTYDVEGAKNLREVVRATTDSAAQIGSNTANVPDTSNVGNVSTKKADIKNEPDELAEYQNDQLIKDHAADALKAIRQGALYPSYADVPQETVSKIHQIIQDAFLSHSLNMRDMTAKIMELGLDETQAHVIARTESTNVANTARKIGWEKMEEDRGEEFQYIWSVYHDDRTSPQCEEIEARVGEGKSLDEIQDIIQEVAEEYIPGWVAEMVPHPNCRSTLVRKV